MTFRTDSSPLLFLLDSMLCFCFIGGRSKDTHTHTHKRYVGMNVGKFTEEGRDTEEEEGVRYLFSFFFPCLDVQEGAECM